MICWKIRIFAYWTTPKAVFIAKAYGLWFAEKFVSLLIEQHPRMRNIRSTYCCDLLKNSYLCLLNNTQMVLLAARSRVVICWKIRIFAYWTTPWLWTCLRKAKLWFAEKFVSLLIEQHPYSIPCTPFRCCDLLKNSYLCLLNNTIRVVVNRSLPVVICWKIRIFAYWTTPHAPSLGVCQELWFAEKFVSLLIEQHRSWFV